jgi:hypothetical protein
LYQQAEALLISMVRVAHCALAKWKKDVGSLIGVVLGVVAFGAVALES